GRLSLSLRAVGRRATDPKRVREILDTFRTERRRNSKFPNNAERGLDEAAAIQQAVNELPDEISDLQSLSAAQYEAILSPAAPAQESKSMTATNAATQNSAAGVFKCGGSTLILDRGSEKHPGVPQYNALGDWRLQSEVERMTASELAERCRLDPEF